jgi:nucleoside diphosphate kinase
MLPRPSVARWRRNSRWWRNSMDDNRIGGEDTTDVWRAVMATDPSEGPPETIREFGFVITETVGHVSDSPESAEREPELPFG